MGRRQVGAFSVYDPGTDRESWTHCAPGQPLHVNRLPPIREAEYPLPMPNLELTEEESKGQAAALWHPDILSLSQSIRRRLTLHKIPA
jgi:hypothetical protein